MPLSVLTGVPVSSCLVISLSVDCVSVLTVPFSASTLHVFVVLSTISSIGVHAGSICMSSPVFSVLMVGLSVN